MGYIKRVLGDFDLLKGDTGVDRLLPTELSPGVWMASNNHSELPSVSEAVDRASVTDTIHILPGTHSVTADVNPEGKQLNWVFHGHLETAGDNPAITFQGGMVHPGGYGEATVPLIVDATNTTTTYAVRYRNRVHSSAILGVRGGAPGHYIAQDVSGDNSNGARLALFAFQANGDGVTMENTTADVPNLNSGEYYVYATGCSGAGLNIVTGLENTFHVVSESNNRGIHIQSGGDRNSFWIRSIESSTNEGILVDSLAEANQVFETVNNSDPVTDNGARTLFDMTGTKDLGVSPTSAPGSAFPDGSVVRNSNADNNETWVKVRGVFVQIA